MPDNHKRCPEYIYNTFGVREKRLAIARLQASAVMALSWTGKRMGGAEKKIHRDDRERGLGLCSEKCAEKTGR